jgi:PKD repeat protein
VVRSADVCSITGANFTSFYNQTEGSLFTNAIFNATSTNALPIVDINDTTAANRLRIYRDGGTGQISLANTSNNTSDVLIAGITVNAGQTIKSACGAKLNNFVFYNNNLLSGSDTLANMIVSPTTFTIGGFSSGVVERQTNGTIAAIRYYRKRLPNAKLASLTA